MADLEIYQLRSLLAVVEHGGMSRAANVLHITQGAVSIQIKRLEEITGKKIFRKDGRNLVLTDSGQALLQYARQIVELNDRAFHHLVSGDEKTTLSLGITTDIVHPFLSEILEEFSKLHEHVRIRPFFNNSTELLSAFRTGNLDLAITIDVSGHGNKIAEASVGWYSSSDPDVARIRPLPIITGDNPSARRMVSFALESENISYEFMPSAADIMTSAAIVNAGLGVTFGIDKLLSTTQFVPVKRGVLPDLPHHGIYINSSNEDETGVLCDLEAIIRRIYQNFFGAIGD